MYDWEKDLCKQLDRLKGVVEELLIYQIQDDIISDVEDLVFRAYARGKENGKKESFNAKANQPPKPTSCNCTCSSK